MNGVLMDPELQSRFEIIERQRTAVGSAALTLSDAQLDWTPGGDVWSVGQIVEHLVLSDETLGRAYDAGAVPREAPMFRALPRAWRRALFLRALRRDTVLPLPSPAVEPRGSAPLPDLLSRWEASRGEMGRVLQTLSDGSRRHFHPVLGPLTAGQMLELGRTHTDYHLRQMGALQRDGAFPQG